MIIRSNSSSLKSRQCTRYFIYLWYLWYFSYESFLRTSLIDILLQLNDKLISLRVIRFEIKSRDRNNEIVRSIMNKFFVRNRRISYEIRIRCYFIHFSSVFSLRNFSSLFFLLYFSSFIYLRFFLQLNLFLFTPSFHFFFSARIPSFSLHLFFFIITKSFNNLFYSWSV